MVIIVKPEQDSELKEKFDLYYCDELCGYMICNEHGVWIYEPHQHAGLLLNAEQIQHLGRKIESRTRN